MLTASLENLITSLAQDAAATQVKFDQSYDNEVALFDEMLKRTPPEWHGLMTGLAPARQVLSKFEISAAVQFSTTTSLGLRIQASPLNVGYAIRFGIDSMGWSRIQVTVEQAPISYERNSNGRH
jgi:hypothetical protein